MSERTHFFRLPRFIVQLHTVGPKIIIPKLLPGPAGKGSLSEKRFPYEGLRRDQVRKEHYQRLKRASTSHYIPLTGYLLISA